MTCSWTGRAGVEICAISIGFYRESGKSRHDGRITAMAGIQENLTQYAAYHRDRRNIATHFVGVPMIVFALIVALATVTIPAAGIVVTGSAILSIAVSAWYLKLDAGLGLVMSTLFFAMCAPA